MGAVRLTVSPLSRNDIAVLTQLFERSFEHYIQNNSPFFIDYLRSLRTVAGLGFAAIVTNGDLICVYKPYQEQFLGLGIGDFRANPHTKSSIASAVAEMVGTAIHGFSILKFPPYYNDFVESLRYALIKASMFGDMKDEAGRISNHLQGNGRF